MLVECVDNLVSGLLVELNLTVGKQYASDGFYEFEGSMFIYVYDDTGQRVSYLAKRFTEVE